MMRHTIFTQFSRRATTCPRSSLRPQVRSRRNQTSGPSSKSDPVSETKSTPSQPPQTSSQPSPPHNKPPTNTTATSAPASPPNTSAVRSRSFRQMIMDGPIGRVGRSYARIQERRPYATQLWSTVVVYLCGDLSAQLMFPPDKKESPREDSDSAEEKKTSTFGESYDPYRTMRHLVVGAGSSIPSYNWFMFLHNHFNFTSKFLSILTKVVVQQSVFTPVFNTYFFSVHSLLSGASFEETWERLKKALPVSITNSAKLWPMVTAFSFMYIPAQFRNIFSGVIAVGWQTYLSWLNQKAAREVEAEERRALAAAETSAMTLSSAVTAKA